MCSNRYKRLWRTTYLHIKGAVHHEPEPSDPYRHKETNVLDSASKRVSLLIELDCGRFGK